MTPSDSYLLRCPSCGTKNRIPARRAGDIATCGKCRNSFNTADAFTDKPVIVTDSDFETKVVKSPLPVLLDCWAPWCGPCRMIGPIIEELALQWKGRIRVCKLNSDENPQISERFQIRSIPTLLIFDKGQVKDSLVGAVPKQQIIRKMAAYL